MPDSEVELNLKPECAKCTKRLCYTEHWEEAEANCPSLTKREVIKEALANYDDPQLSEFARNASLQEAECYMRLPSGMTTIHPRVEETAQFAKKMGYKKLGIAFCIGLGNESRILTTILESKGFDIVSVCCKCGGIPKERIGLEPQQKIGGPDRYESMCNPIAQAEILNSENTDFNIVVGLCVGHDALFLKYVKALTTVLIVKDRVFGHNPAAGLYLSGSYYRRLLRKES